MSTRGRTLTRVEFSEYSKRFFLKKIEKKYPGSIWKITLESIVYDLSRLRMPGFELQKTMQVDELWHKDTYWIFKYDFRIFKTRVSSKASGNRLVAFLDLVENKIVILLIYDKGMLPKNKNEGSFIKETIEENFPDYFRLCR